MHLSVTRRLLPVERRKYYTVDLLILFYHLAWHTQEIIFIKYNEWYILYMENVYSKTPMSNLLDTLLVLAFKGFC